MTKDIVIEPKKLSDEEKKATYSKVYTTPSCCATDAITAMFSKAVLLDDGLTGLDLATIHNILKEQNERVANGDMTRVEAMLIDQAHTLQAMSTLFTIKMSKSEYLNQTETYSRIALKAQNQCRQTLATLIEMKNPKRATFIKQQNNNVGNQQVNNGQPVSQSENSKNSEKPANKLLEVETCERLDIGTQRETVPANPQLETVGTVDRPKKQSRKKQGKPERP